jgi:CRISPR-associated protein (TIGR03984 family)
MAELAGCLIEPLDDSACRPTLAWITGSREVQITDGVELLLAHCYDGVTWGRLDHETSEWRLACIAFAARAPMPVEQNLLELRLFGKALEILIWREERGFRGRRLSDQAYSEEHLRPMDESRILLGDRLLEPPKGGFSRVGSPTGAEQVVPVEIFDEVFQKSPWPLRLDVRHYLEADDETGAVRIAATRLVGLEVKRP